MCYYERGNVCVCELGCAVAYVCRGERETIRKEFHYTVPVNETDVYASFSIACE